MNRPQVAYFLSGVLAYFPSGAHTALARERRQSYSSRSLHVKNVNITCHPGKVVKFRDHETSEAVQLNRFAWKLIEFAEERTPRRSKKTFRHGPAYPR